MGGPPWETVFELVICTLVGYWRMFLGTTPKRKGRKQNWTEGELEYEFEWETDAAEASADPMGSYGAGITFPNCLKFIDLYPHTHQSLKMGFS